MCICFTRLTGYAVQDTSEATREQNEGGQLSRKEGQLRMGTRGKVVFLSRRCAYESCNPIRRPLG